MLLRLSSGLGMGLLSLTADLRPLYRRRVSYRMREDQYSLLNAKFAAVI